MSVDNPTTFFTLSIAISIMFIAPIIFTLTHSKGLYSAVGAIFVVRHALHNLLHQCSAQPLSVTHIAYEKAHSSITFIVFSHFHCLISSRENIISFSGLSFSSVIETNLFKMNPYTVIKIVESLGISVTLFHFSEQSHFITHSSFPLEIHFFDFNLSIYSIIEIEGSHPRALVCE